MGEILQTQQQGDEHAIMHTYARADVCFVSGEGMRLYDDEGKEYLDFLSGIGAVSLGHAHLAVTRAICEQAHKLLHVSNLFYVENRAELAEEISELLGGGWKLFYANSGAEANEGAIKLARKWAQTNKPQASQIVTALDSFHGRTLATIAATGQPAKRAAFEPVPEGFSHVPLNDSACLEETIGESTIAVMLECIQGEGGVWPCTPEYLQRVRELCDRTNTVLIIDEVQTGFYRTGKPFSFQHFGIVPDVVTIAKGMGNGVPIGAVCARGAFAETLVPGDHGTTFGGSPLVCAASLATVRTMRENDMGAHVDQIGDYFAGQLAKLPLVADVRGKGLMVGVSLTEPIAPRIVEEGLKKGFVFNGIGDGILRFLPPLICAKEDVDALIQGLAAIIESSHSRG